MHRSSIAVIAVVSAVAFTQIAFAADLPRKAPPAPPPPPVFSWTGFYIGANAGGAWDRNEINTTQFAPVPPFFAIDNAAVSAAASPTINSAGFTGGIQAGYNWQMGNVVLGIEADFEYLGLRGSDGGTFPFPSTLPGGPLGPPTAFFSTNTSYRTDWLFTLRPRLGWAINNWLLYATGGLAVGREKFNQTITLLTPFVETASFSTTRTGWAAGAGVEYAFSQHWSIRGEYLHVDLGTVDTTGTIAPPFAGFFPTSSIHLTTNIGRAAINYRF
jgi:outer membrane immunogenic protein